MERAWSLSTFRGATIRFSTRTNGSTWRFGLPIRERRYPGITPTTARRGLAAIDCYSTIKGTEEFRWWTGDSKLKMGRRRRWRFEDTENRAIAWAARTQRKRH